ncbi:HD-GYP domain-containing protein [Catenovulum sp. 2E275]|uniref:HD-GYP domain-containing protein n=1 Tax=Catenovulum sp. 2E275 TaxID=2980497 RepID=UPI0021D18437|nr:HD-GYP domain-containing protein [Catenovulum sp. 2E275]MCU4676075.1 HD-GYP domain-containing protein [Catenovulum sp. 2E275]
MLKIIPIKQLEVGMYVTAVTKQHGQVLVKSQGWIKSKGLIDQLIKKGIDEVQIDPDKTLKKPETEPQIIEEKPVEQEKIPYKTTPVQQEIKRANKLYQQAKTLQSKILQDISSGHKIDLKPAQELTSQLIDSIFRNQDALSCLARIREKDAYLMEHSLNVSILISMFAKHLNLPRQTIETLALAAFLHDIGKILIPDEILHKPGRLTAEEFDVMKSHVIKGVDSLSQVDGISSDVIQIVIQHHEKLDGSGYPNGLKNQQIDQAGRMIAIVDIYDAMTAERVYKKGMSPSAALKMMLGMTPNSLDIELLQQFIRCIGIHPVGSLVLLTSGKLGIVTESNPENPLQPIIKVFYHTKYQRHSEIKDIDLSKPYCDESIEKAVKPEDFKIDLHRFFREVLLS